MRQFERSLMLQTLDHHWREHLSSLDHLRQGIHLRGYAQKNPKQEYKREAFELFSDMLDRIKQDVVKVVLTVQVRSEQDVQAVEEAESRVQRASTSTPTTTRRWPAPADDGDVGGRAAAAVHARGREGRPQRSVPVRLGQEVQALPRQVLMRPAPPPVSRAVATHRRRPSRCCPVPGVALGAAAAKIKKWDRNDVLLVVCDPGTVAAGVFTQNRFCAAPVTVCREHLARQHSRRRMRALIVNAGNANAGTGDAGLADAHAECVAVARLLDCAPEEVLPYSTGVIMEPLPVERILERAARGAHRGARRRLVRRRQRDHDDGHRAQGRVAPRRRRRRRRSRSPASPRAPA